MTTVAVRNDRAAPDLRHGSRLLAAVLLPIGPAAIALLRFLLPYSTTDDVTGIEAEVRAAPDRMSVVLWLGLIGVLTLVPGVLAAGRLAKRWAPRLTAVALLLMVPGYVSIGWMAAGDVLVWTGVHAGADPQTVIRWYDAMHPSVEAAETIFVAGHVLGTILLGLAFWQSTVVPRWAAVLTIVSQPLHAFAAVVLGNHPLDLVAWGMQTIAFVAVAIAVLRTPDDEWDLPPIRR